MSDKKQLEKMLRLANIKKKPLNEGVKSSSIEFIKSSSDGSTYAIVRENRTYYIKSTKTKHTLLESDFNYLGGLQNRTKNSFRGYDDAVTRLNLMFNDHNRVNGINESTDMVNFSHTLNEDGEYVDESMVEDIEPLQEKRFILKQPKPKVKKEPETDFGGDTEGGDDFDFGGEEGGDAGTEEGGDDFDFGGEEGGDAGAEEGGDDFDFGGEEGDTGDTEGGDDFDFGGEEDTEDTEGGDNFDFGGEEGGDTEGGDTIKDIQRTTGKLGQQLRDTEDISSDMQKWVAKSVISALNLNTMDDADKSDIINALESGGSDEESNGGDDVDIDFMDDNMEYGEVEYAGGRTMDGERGGEPDLESGEEILLDDGEDEGPGGYIGGYDNYEEEVYDDMPLKDVDMGIQDKGIVNMGPESMNGSVQDISLQSNNIDYMDDFDNTREEKYDLDYIKKYGDRPRPVHEPHDYTKDIEFTPQAHRGKMDPSYDPYEFDQELSDEEKRYDDVSYMDDEEPSVPKRPKSGPRGVKPSEGPMSYITDDEMELCEDDGCGEPMGEGMSSFEKADNEGGMGWETANESVSYMGDEYSEEDIDRMFDNTGISDDIYGMNNPQETPAQPTTKPGTDSPTPTRPSKNPFTPPSRIRPGEEDKPKAAEPRPSQNPNEAPTIAPDTDTPAPTRPSKNPFTPPSRIRPGEEDKPKARKNMDYMDDGMGGDAGVEFS